MKKFIFALLLPISLAQASKNFIVNIIDGNGIKEQKILTQEQLLNDPLLVERSMIAMLNAGNTAMLSVLLPLYQHRSQPDPIIINWSEALFASERGDYQKAYRIYRSLLKEHQHLIPIRLQLAILLLTMNKKDSAFRLLEEVQKTHHSFYEPTARALLAQRSETNRHKFFNNFSLIYDPNLKRIAPAGTKIAPQLISTEQQQQSFGIGYYLGYRYNFDFDHNINELGFAIKGKNFFTAQTFDNLNLSTYAYFARDLIRFRLGIRPSLSLEFGKKQHYSPWQFYHYRSTYGIAIIGSFNLGERSVFAPFLQFDHNRYYDTKLNEYRIQLGGQIDYSWQQTKLNVYAHILINASEKSFNRYHQYQIGAGFTHIFPQGVMIYPKLQYSKTLFAGARHFYYQQFNQKQNDDTILAELTFGHGRLQLFGFTPVLNLAYHVHLSNNKFEQYQGSSLSFELRKDF